MAIPPFTYNQNLPNPPDDPADDVGGMQVNSQSIYSYTAADHIPFQSQNNGAHKQSTYIDLSVLSLAQPATLQSNSVVVWANNSSGVQSNLFANSDAGGVPNLYQLTRFLDTSFATFGTNPGWTFLPGNILFQYGTATTTGALTPIIFPVPFTLNAYAISALRNQTSDTVLGYQGLSKTGFSLFTEGSTASGISFTWMAIGV